jgi:uncharacterized protein (DUF736 family)
MIIGNFAYDKKTDTYAGDVTTLTFSRPSVQLRPNEKSGTKEPDYRVVSETAHGLVEFGAAWQRKSENGKEFLSVAIDDPALAGSLNAALFRSEDGKTAALVWTRQKKRPKEN